MARLHFYAARSDLQALISYLFAETDLRMFEKDSRFGEELREFHSFAELDACFPVGSSPQGGHAAYLALWSPSAMSSFQMRRMALDPRRCQGHTFRYEAVGWGMMYLYLGGRGDRGTSYSYYGHAGKESTLCGGAADVANWPLLSSLSRRILYHVRKRLAVCEVNAMPVLPEAYTLALAGESPLIGSEQVELSGIRDG